MSSSRSYSGTSYVTCYCGEVAVVRTSTTDENPGKRFFGCNNFGHGDHCDFFDWVDASKTVSKQEKETYKLMNNLRVANEDLRSVNQSIKETNSVLRNAVSAERRMRIDMQMKLEVIKAELKMWKKWTAVVLIIILVSVLMLLAN